MGAQPPGLLNLWFPGCFQSSRDVEPPPMTLDDLLTTVTKKGFKSFNRKKNQKYIFLAS